MIRNWKAALSAAVLSVSMFAAGAALTTSAHAQMTPVPYRNGGLRGESGSFRNLHHVRQRLETLISELQRDQRDYGGHRVAAINLMQQARAELIQAEQYDKSHGM
jgi:Spy/CpxP family protein refolding chaperone